MPIFQACENGMVYSCRLLMAVLLCIAIAHSIMMAVAMVRRRRRRMEMICRSYSTLGYAIISEGEKSYHCPQNSTNDHIVCVSHLDCSKNSGSSSSKYALYLHFINYFQMRHDECYLLWPMKCKQKRHVLHLGGSFKSRVLLPLLQRLQKYGLRWSLHQLGSKEMMSESPLLIHI